MVTLTRHACKYKVHKLHQRYILKIFHVFVILEGMFSGPIYILLSPNTGTCISHL